MDLREEVEEMEKEVKNISLATEMLKELKQQNKRQHIVIIVQIIVIVAMIIGFLLYESQFETVGETTTIDSGNGIVTYLEKSKAGDVNGKNN